MSDDLTPAEHRQREKAALKHGLWSRSRGNLRVRHYRAGRMLTRLQDVLPLTEVDLPAARAWCELEVLCQDAFAVLQAPGGLQNTRLLEQYRGMRRDQLAYAREMGMTPAARVQLSAVNAGAQRDGLASQLAAARARRIVQEGEKP